MKTERKQFLSPFLVEKSKLTRLMDVIETRFNQGGTAPACRFEVHLLGQKIIETASIEDVLAVDNSKRNRVERLLLTCSSDAPSGQEPDRDLLVDFDGRA